MRFVFAAAITLFTLVSATLVNAQTAASCIRHHMQNIPAKTGTELTVERLVLDISSAFSLPHGIRIIPCDFVDNVQAYVLDQQGATAQNLPLGEYIIYKPSWVRSNADSNNTKLIFLFGHEIGHFAARHFGVHRDKHPRRKELEADGFGGCAVGRLSGDWDSLEGLLVDIRPEFGIDYPSRVEAASIAQERFLACGGVAVTAPSPNIPPVSLPSDVTLRAECRKTSDRGCTAHNSVCYNAPEGYYIRAGSLSQTATIVSHWKKQPRCLVPTISTTIPYVDDSTGIAASLATGFCATLHVESGSGFSDLGKVAFVDCRYNFELSQVP